MDTKEAGEAFVRLLNRCCYIGTKCYELGSKPIVIPEDSRVHKALSGYFDDRRRQRIVELESSSTLSRFTIVGRVNKGTKTKFCINGNDFAVTNETWVIGVLGSGTIAKVEGVIIPGIGRLAKKIKVVERAAHV